MSTKYEDNFGFYCIDDNDPEELEFFCHIRAPVRHRPWRRPIVKRVNNMRALQSESAAAEARYVVRSVFTSS
jgi:hypothetical protein